MWRKRGESQIKREKIRRLVRDDRSRVGKSISDSRCTLWRCSNLSEADGLRDRLETSLTALVIKATREAGHQCSRGFLWQRFTVSGWRLLVFLRRTEEFNNPPIFNSLSSHLSVHPSPAGSLFSWSVANEWKWQGYYSKAFQILLAWNNQYGVG